MTSEEKNQMWFNVLMDEYELYSREPKTRIQEELEIMLMLSEAGYSQDAIYKMMARIEKNKTTKTEVFDGLKKIGKII